ncbi:MAG: response regulator [Lachnospiraceae bacterium]|nr:response regulator [Lachnospiraceae bacterium]
MLIAVETFFLILTMIVVWTYILSGTYYRVHRLLPLIMGLIVAFQFCELARLIFGFNFVFRRLNDLILIQACYFVACYFEDYLEVKIPRPVHFICFILMLSTDAVVFSQSVDHPLYRIFMLVFFLVCVVLVVSLQVRATFVQSYSRREGKINALIGIALGVPGIVVLYDTVFGEPNGFQLVICLEVSLFIIWYLVVSGQIIDTRSVLNESVFDSSEIPTMLFDTDFYLITANDVAKKMLVEKGFLSENMRKKEYRKLAAAVRVKIDGQEEVIGEGTYRWQITNVEYKGRISGYITQLLDVSAQKEETRQMEMLKDAAEEQSVLKAKFLAMQSHELRSPLQAIIGISQILSAKKEISPQDRRLAQHINSSGNTLLRIVNSILDFSKLEAGHFELTSRPYDFMAVLMELAQMSLVNLDKKPVLFSIEVQSMYPSVVVGDEMCVKEMIQNILSNAIKFTSEGEIRCYIEFSEVPDGVVMTCKVKDTGTGMTPEQQEHIFDDYASYASQTAKEGTGLGLSLVSRMAKMMHGGAWAESDGVTGSTIGFAILQGVADNAERKPPTSIDQFSFKGNKLNSANRVHPSYCYPDANVLIVDDMQINRHILKELTEPWKFKVDEADDGTTAVEAVKNNHYDLIVLDLRMEKMNGDEAARIIRGMCDTPLILMSANLFDNTRDEYLTKGFDAILSKPLEMPEIKGVLESFLPEEKRIAAEDVTEAAERDSFRQIETKKKTLQTFRGEIYEAGLDIQKTYMLDINLFQTRVHGIKGAARQLGYVYVADKSEIMEMAAKAGHTSYIERYINEYADDLFATVDELDSEIQLVDMEINRNPGKSTAKISASREEIDKLFSEMKEGFELYNYDKIEECANKLDALALDDSERAFLDEAVKALEDFDYELGVKLFVDRQRLA